MRWWVRKNEFILQLCKFKFCISQLGFFWLEAHILKEELYMSEDTKNLARASSMTNGAWTRGEFVTCFRPPHVNWIRAKFGEMMQSSLCSNSSRCSKIILQIDPEKCQWAVGHLKLKGFPWCRSRLSPSVSKFFARVVECLWRSSWNWASEATLTFGSTRNT